MSQCKIVLDALKQQLKHSKKNYADIAEYLDLSESSVKRLLNSNTLSLQRLEKICHFLGIELIDLMRAANHRIKRLTRLSHDQEHQLVQDEKLLLVMVSILNGNTFAGITEQYQYDDTECYLYLKQLEKLHIIDLLPFNRFKILIADDFSWIPHGPIETFFNTHLRKDYLAADFKGKNELYLCLNGMLTDNHTEILKKKLQQIKQFFHSLHRECISTDYNHSENTSLLIALRPWIPEIFDRYKR